jgi:hypothetical protein
MRAMTTAARDAVTAAPGATASRISSDDAIRGAVMLLMAALSRLPLAAVGAIGIAIIAGHNLVGPWLFANHAMGNPPAPAGYAWSSPLLYLVRAAAIALLYPACRWFAGLKSSRSDWWLRTI